MIKKPLLSALFLIFIFSLAYRSSDKFQHYILYLTDFITLSYSHVTELIGTSIVTHFNQAETIKKLTKKLYEYEQFALKATTLEHQIKTLSSLENFPSKTPFNLTLVKTLSYAQMGDFYKIRLNFKEFNKSKIYGIIQNQNAAGIVIEENNRPVGLLNGHEKCGYSVFIGNKQAPGIIKGRKKGEEILVDYIPAWVEIRAGDEVITSGLDNIFFHGIKVGKVTLVEQAQGYKTASVKPYADALNPTLYWLVHNNRL
jgi:rod shape-determining protein MreC